MKRARGAKRGATRAKTVPTAPAAASDTSVVTVPVLAPRNPFQELARKRKAGSHDVDTRKRRRIEENELRRRLAEE